MNSSTTPLLFSLKPHYAELIFKGLKKAELRRRDLRRMKGRDVFIYVTSPVMQLQGGFHVGEVLTGKPQDIWNEVSDYAGVEESDFEAYYSGRELACALKITKVWEYEYPIGLDKLKTQFTSFVVPQSWRYVKPDEHESFRRMKMRDERARASVAAPAQAAQGQSPLLQPESA